MTVSGTNGVNGAAFTHYNEGTFLFTVRPSPPKALPDSHC
jgi:hypothetical protein